MANGKPSQQASSGESLVLNSIARSVAYLAMHKAELADSDLATKVDFLERMGLNRTDCAAVLETTAESIRVTLSKARDKAKDKPKKGARRG